VAASQTESSRWGGGLNLEPAIVTRVAGAAVGARAPPTRQHR